MGEHTGPIEKFMPPSRVKVGGTIFHVGPDLYLQVAKGYTLGDRVQVNYVGELKKTGRRASVEARSVVRRTDIQTLKNRVDRILEMLEDVNTRLNDLETSMGESYRLTPVEGFRPRLDLEMLSEQGEWDGTAD